MDDGWQSRAACLIWFHSITLAEDVFGCVSHRPLEARDLISQFVSLWTQHALLTLLSSLLLLVKEDFPTFLLHDT